MQRQTWIPLVLGLLAVSPLIVEAQSGERSEPLVTVDHYVRHASTVPAIAGETVQLYVRERVQAGLALRGSVPQDRVVLFVHGAGTPAEVAFDVPYEDYSWMAYLARAGFDVFSMDVTGYGRSTRPHPMNDPCNLSQEQQRELVASVLDATCQPTYPYTMGTIGADWDDIGAVVDYILELRGAENVSIVAWSLGGPRSGGYAARHPEKVSRLVLLAPAYDRNASDAAPEVLPAEGAAMTKQSRQDFLANWDRQVGCAGQYDPAVREVVWEEMMVSDPVGATWGPGVRRAPRTTSWGWNAALVGRTETPTLMIAGIHDAQVPASRVRELYEDFGAAEKVLLDLGCASHNAMWERNHLLLFNASLEWLLEGTAEGQRSGIVRLGY